MRTHVTTRVRARAPRLVRVAGLVLGVVACSPAGDATSPRASAPAAAPVQEPAMAAIDRYREFLVRTGADRNASVIDSAALALGDWHFYELEGGASRAAAAPVGLVGGGERDPHDAWYAFLAAADAATVAARIAWLDHRGGPQHGPGTVVVTGSTPPAARIDPMLWRAARPPRRDELPGGGRRLTAWFYSDGDEPYQLAISAPATGPATIESHAAHTLVDPGDLTGRVMAALAGTDDQMLRWALITAAKQPLGKAAPAIAALLTRTDATLRTDAAVALASLRAPATIDALAAACSKETDGIARQTMLSALGNIGTAAAVDALVGLRGRIADAAMRLDLVHALARAAESTPDRAHAALAAIARDDANPEVRKLARAYAAP